MLMHGLFLEEVCRWEHSARLVRAEAARASRRAAADHGRGEEQRPRRWAFLRSALAAAAGRR
ncbi:hypothetical protein H5T53_05660 [Candidatus Bipolaricaulota bacterium]|nr:hypothetical protein [Candidatus Bipolaricaulota bacterium]